MVTDQLVVYAMLLVGILLPILLWVYSFVSREVDPRFFPLAWVFSIPYAALKCYGLISSSQTCTLTLALLLDNSACHILLGHGSGLALAEGFAISFTLVVLVQSVTFIRHLLRRR